MPLTGVPFAGETIEVTVRAARTTGQVVRSGVAEVDFWAPGADTSQPPDYVLPAAWDNAARGFLCLADTAGWAPGTWLYRGRVTADTDAGPVKGMTEFTPLPLR
jgi:hypothetical protein